MFALVSKRGFRHSIFALVGRLPDGYSASRNTTENPVTSLERIRRIIKGESVDHLPAQPMLMMFAAKHAGMRFIDYTKDGRKMAEAQLKMAEDFGVDCLL